jgi:DNA-binding response OmpR family regulator
LGVWVVWGATLGGEFGMSTEAFLCAPDAGSNGTGACERLPSLLLIEDNPMVSHMLASAIEECGFTVVKTGTFETFKQRLAERLPDAVAMDLSMPDCDGAQLMEELARHAFSGLVLIISGLEVQLIEEARRFGLDLWLRMADPLAKPFRFDELARRLAEAASPATP